MLLLHVCIAFFVLCLLTIQSVLIRAPSIFRSDETDLHKYSVVLAATEPFRLQCEHQIRQSINPFSYIYNRALGKSSLEFGQSQREKNVAIDVALTRFEVRLQNTLRAYGMNVERFNSLSEMISKEKVLKKRILLQSYLYKLAADLEFNLRQVMPSLPSIGQDSSFARVKSPVSSMQKLPNANSIPNVRKDSKPNPAITPVSEADDEIPEISRFARALNTIESERIKIRERIKRELQLRDLPPRMADPEFLPAMCPTIQKACKDFPHLANHIIQRNGLHVEEFNLLQEKLSKNMFFRYQIKKEIDKLKLNEDARP